MTADELRQRFPNASEEFIRRNTTSAILTKATLAGLTMKQAINLPMSTPEKPRLRQKAGDGMNKTEREFGFYLLGHDVVGTWTCPQKLTLRLGNGVRYTPDYVTFAPETYVQGELKTAYVITAYEVKGFMRDDAAVKLKVAASLYPFITFKLVTKKKKSAGGGWQIETVHP